MELQEMDAYRITVNLEDKRKELQIKTKEEIIREEINLDTKKHKLHCLPQNLEK